MTRENLAFNPSFRNGTTGYTALNGATLAIKTGFAFYGNEALQVTKPARNGAGVQTSNIAVTPGLKYAYSAYVAVPPIAPKQESAGLVLTVTWLTAAGVIVSTDSTPIVTVAAGGGWDRLTGVDVAPDGAASASLAISQLVAGSARQTFFVDAILFEQAAYVGGYLDNVTRALHSHLQDAGLSAFPLPTIGGLQLRADITLGDLVLNTIDENNVTWICTDIDGLWGHADPDMTDIERGVDDGSYDVSGRYKARTFTLEGSFLLDDPNKLTATRDRLIAATNLVRKGAWLRTNEEPTRATFVRLNGRPKIETVNARGRTDFSIGLKAADPIRYEWNDTDPDGLTTVDIDVPPTVINYMTNPGFETSSGTGIVRTNSINNPSAEGATPSLAAVGSSGSSVSVVSDALTGSNTKSYKVTTGTTTNTFEGAITDPATTVAGSRWGFSTKCRIDPNTYGAHRFLSVLRYYNSSGTQLASTDGPRVDLIPDGVSHRWTGTPNASTSEEYVGTTRRVNYVVNPNFEAGINFWSSTGGSGSIAAANTPYFGTACAAITTGTTDLSGAQTFLSNVPIGSDYTASAYVLAPVGYKYKLRLSNNSTQALVSAAVGTGTWQRLSVTMLGVNTTAAPSVQVVADGAGTGATLLVDGVMLEIASSVGTYFDGSTATPITGAYRAWLGTPYASASIERRSDGTERTNYALDPTIANGVDPGNSIIQNIGSGQFGRSILAGASPSGGYAFRATASNPSGASAVGLGMVTAPVSPGAYSVQFWMRHNDPANIGVVPYTEGTATATASPTALIPIPPGVWTKITYTLTVTGAGTLKPGVIANASAVGITVDYADWLVERSGSSTSGAVFDGATVDSSLVLPTGSVQTPITLSVIAAAPSGTASVRGVIFRSPDYGVNTPNEAFYVDELMLTQLGTSDTTVPAYFDGNSALSDAMADSELSYTWAGTPNASYSNISYATPAKITSKNAVVRVSKVWALGGTFSARISPGPSANRDAYLGLLPMVQGTLTPGNTYTLSLTVYRDVNGTEASSIVYGGYVGDTLTYEAKAAIPAAAGTYPLSLTFTVPSSVSSQALGVYNTEPANGNSLWVDNVILTDGADIIEYFDGGSDDTTSAIYTWSGSANQSTSIKSPGPVTVGSLQNIGTANVTGTLTLRGPLGAGSYVYNAATGETTTITNELRGIGGAAPIAYTQLTNNVATITTMTPHNLEVGDKVIIAGAGTPYDSENGYWTITAVNDIYPYTFNFNRTWADLTYVSNGGQVNLAEVDVLSLDTYQRSVVFNDDGSGNRSRVATLVDWMQFAPGENVISFVDVPAQRQVTTKASSAKVAGLTTTTAHYLQPGEQVYVNLPVNSALAKKSLTSNVVTITTAADHGFSVGDKVDVVSTETSTINRKSRTSNVTTLRTAVLGAFNVGDTIVVSLPTTTKITRKSLTSNVATLTTAEAHGFSIGDSVVTTFPSVASISGKGVSAGQASVDTATSHGFAIGDSISISMPVTTSVVNKFIQGTNVVLTASSAHGYSIGDTIVVNLPTSATLTNTRTMAGPSSYLATLNTSSAHGFVVGDLVSVTTNITDNWVVTNRASTTSTMTLTIGAHNVQVGEVVTVSSVGAQYNGTWTVTAVSATTISYGNFGVPAAYIAETSIGSLGQVVNASIRNGYNGVHAIEAVPSATSFSFLYYGQQTNSSNSTVSSTGGTVANTTNAPIVGTFRLSGTPSATQFSYQTTDTVNTGGTTPTSTPS